MSEKDEFEAWAKGRFYLDTICGEDGKSREYAYDTTHAAWAAWKAARATQAVPALTDEEIDSMAIAHEIYCVSATKDGVRAFARALAAASPAGQVRDLVDTAFQAIFDAYNQPGDRFENDYAWCLNVRKKVGDAYTPLQQARAILAAPKPSQEENK